MMSKVKGFKTDFASYVCEGDKIECEVDGFHCVATLYRDDNSGSPDERDDGFWPSLDPHDAGYIGPKSKATLKRRMENAVAVMDAWKNDEWHYYGIAVTIWKAGVRLTGEYSNAIWGIEGNYPAVAKPRTKKRINTNVYFRSVANELLGEALREAEDKLAALINQKINGESVMSKKDFELIAKTIRFLDVSLENKQVVANEFCRALRATNPRFNKSRFYNACIRGDE